MKKKIYTNSIPVIIMLVAAGIDYIISMYQHMALTDMINRLLIVMVIFWFVGLVIKMILDKCISIMADKDEDTDSPTDSDDEEMKEK